EGHVSSRRSPDYNRIHKVADGPGKLRTRPATRRHTHRYFVLPRITVKQCLKRSEQRHEERRSLFLTHSPDALQQMLADGHFYRVAAKRLHGRTSLIEGQIQWRAGSGKLPFPEASKLFSSRTVEQFRLPTHKFGVVAARRQDSSLRVKPAELAEHRSKRPEV